MRIFPRKYAGGGRGGGGGGVRSWNVLPVCRSPLESAQTKALELAGIAPQNCSASPLNPSAKQMMDCRSTRAEACCMIFEAVSRPDCANPGSHCVSASKSPANTATTTACECCPLLVSPAGELNPSTGASPNKLDTPLSTSRA